MSPVASASKPMKCAGVCSASIRTRLSAGWMRCDSDPSPAGCGRRSDAGRRTPSSTQRGSQFVAHGLDQFREVAAEFLAVARLLNHFVAVPEHQRTEAVPLRGTTPVRHLRLRQRASVRPASTGRSTISILVDRPPRQSPAMHEPAGAIASVRGRSRWFASHQVSLGFAYDRLSKRSEEQPCVSALLSPPRWRSCYCP